MFSAYNRVVGLHLKNGRIAVNAVKTLTNLYLERQMENIDRINEWVIPKYCPWTTLVIGLKTTGPFCECIEKNTYSFSVFDWKCVNGVVQIFMNLIEEWRSSSSSLLLGQGSPYRNGDIWRVRGCIQWTYAHGQYGHFSLPIAVLDHWKAIVDFFL